MTFMSELETSVDYHSPNNVDLDDRVSFREVASSYLKKSADVLFKIRSFEKSGKLYKALGVKPFQKLHKYTYGALVNFLADRDVYSIKGNSTEVLSLQAWGTKVYEVPHQVFNVLMINSMYNNYLDGEIGMLKFNLVGNILINVYPIMLQRYKRNRLEKVLEHRAKRGVSK